MQELNIDVNEERNVESEDFELELGEYAWDEEDKSKNRLVIDFDNKKGYGFIEGIVSTIIHTFISEDEEIDVSILFKGSLDAYFKENSQKFRRIFKIKEDALLVIVLSTLEASYALQFTNKNIFDMPEILKKFVKRHAKKLIEDVALDLSKDKEVTSMNLPLCDLYIPLKIDYGFINVEHPVYGVMTVNELIKCPAT